MASIKLLWRFLEKKDTIWHDWVECNLIRGRTIWEAAVYPNASVRWKNILIIRDTVRPKIKFMIGSGQNVDFWEDWWCLSGPLIKQQGLRRARVRAYLGELKVSQFINQGVWDCTELNLPSEILEAIQRTPIHRNRDDWPIWTPTNSRNLSSKTVYEEVRARGQIGHWNKLFWFKKHIPKFSFISWLVAMGRISTFDKMRNWNISVNSECLLCNAADENRNHLFFECYFSKSILKKGFQWCCTRFPAEDSSWDTIYTWFIDHVKGNSFREHVLKIFWTSCIHRIWMERNHRLHNRSLLRWERIVAQIKNDVALACSNLKNIPNSALHSDICQNWGISPLILSVA